VIEIHDAFAVTVQEQPALVLTLAKPLPPSDANDEFVGEMLYAQAPQPGVVAATRLLFAD
jgi:hypothetical protein